MGAAGGGRRFLRPGAPVLVLLLIAAAALPRQALAVTDAADGNAPCVSLLASLEFGYHELLATRLIVHCLPGWVIGVYCHEKSG
jgi:hypothetical protein